MGLSLHRSGTSERSYQLDVDQIVSFVLGVNDGHFKVKIRLSFKVLVLYLLLRRVYRRNHARKCTFQHLIVLLEKATIAQILSMES